MDSASLDTPKIFISYSWKPIANKQETLKLAERLSSNGIHVVIDEWDLSEGQDKYTFMEQMVNNPEIKRVLIICNQDYVEKANQKKGGVGTESLIISNDIYSKADQKKFIPIVFQKNEKGEPYLPTFIVSRIFINLSLEDTFEDEYDKLLRNIFEKPLSRRPPIGTIPSHLLEEEPVFLPTANKIRTIHNALINEKKNYQTFIDDYYSAFLEALKIFKIEDKDLGAIKFIDDVIVDKIGIMLPLRDDFINFLDEVFTFSTEFNQDKFESFIEKLVEFYINIDDPMYTGNQFGALKNDHYKFFYNELFLYISAIMIEKERFSELGNLLHSNFIVHNKRTEKVEVYNYLAFRHYAVSLEETRNKRLDLKRRSFTADLIKQRANHPIYTFEKIRECDIICYYVSLMREKLSNIGWIWSWWPHTTVYGTTNLLLTGKLISKKYFEKVKPIFGVNNIHELKEKIEVIRSNNLDNVERFYNRFPLVTSAFNFDKIAIH